MNAHRFCCQGPQEDQEAESELTITEMKLKHEREKLEKELLAKQRSEGDGKMSASQNTDDGCSWGLDSLDAPDDDPEIDPDAPNPFALEPHLSEELYLDDPKKTLRGYFEREGTHKMLKINLKPYVICTMSNL